MNSFSLRKNRSHLEPGQLIWSQVSQSTGCHPKCRLWTTPSLTVFANRVRIARQMAGWKTKNNKFFYIGIRALEKRWTKRISVTVVYVEKW